MRAEELLKHATCSICRQKIGHTGIPLFWVLKVERLGIKLDAVRRRDGLAMMMGSNVLAGILGPDEEMTEPVMDPVELTVCENCMMEKLSLIAAVVEENNR